jgi:hypothetical protein
VALARRSWDHLDRPISAHSNPAFALPYAKQKRKSKVTHAARLATSQIIENKQSRITYPETHFEVALSRFRPFNFLRLPLFTSHPMRGGLLLRSGGLQPAIFSSSGAFASDSQSPFVILTERSAFLRDKGSLFVRGTRRALTRAKVFRGSELQLRHIDASQRDFLSRCSFREFFCALSKSASVQPFGVTATC